MLKYKYNSKNMIIKARKIYKRNIADEILKYIGTDNIVVLHGARQVGKTYILYYLMNILKKRGDLTHFIDLEDSRFVGILDKGIDEFLSYLHDIGIDEKKILQRRKKVYVFIDEIQYLHSPSPFLKLLADHYPQIQLIVSGSSSFNIKSKFSDSLVGRTVDFEIFPLLFEEFLRFKNRKYSLDAIASDLIRKDIINLYEEYIYYGGYPKIILAESVKQKEMYLQQIVDTYIRKDIKDLADIKDTRKFNNMLKVLASQSGQLLNVSALSDTCGIAKQTVERYLFILENTYIIKLLAPFSRSTSVEVVKAPKIFFYDTGLLQMLWLDHIKKSILGNMFETNVFTELVKKFGVKNIHFWRTKNQTEIDFILEKNGSILPIEVKQSFRNLRKTALQSFAKRYKTKNYKVVGLYDKRKDTSCIYPWEL